MADFLSLISVSVISAATGLGGVFLGGWLSDQREREKRRNDFIARQLAEFYGPLVSLRAEIQARGELRVKIGNAIDRKHARDLIEAGKYGGQKAIRQVTDVNVPPMMAVMQDEDVVTAIGVVFVRHRAKGTGTKKGRPPYRRPSNRESAPTLRCSPPSLR